MSSIDVCSKYRQWLMVDAAMVSMWILALVGGGMAFDVIGPTNLGKSILGLSQTLFVAYFIAGFIYGIWLYRTWSFARIIRQVIGGVFALSLIVLGAVAPFFRIWYSLYKVFTCKGGS